MVEVVACAATVITDCKAEKVVTLAVVACAAEQVALCTNAPG
jgi:hypothetical protein